MNKNLVKWVVIFGGGFLSFMLLKPKKKDLELAQQASSAESVTESFDSKDSEVKPSKENAELVASAYTMALQNNEPQSALTELNKECMKEYGLSCYMDNSNKVIVSDSSGNVILKK
jgi:hypothetical protein